MVTTVKHPSICKKEHTITIPLAKPVLSREMETAAVDALRNERFVLGESVLKFEEEFAEYCGVDFAVSTSSGTAALSIALIARASIQVREEEGEKGLVVNMSVA